MDHPFLSKWADWKVPKKPPYYLSDDKSVLMERMPRRLLAWDYHSWKHYLRDPHFDQPAYDRRLRLDLLPHPFSGDPPTAKIVILSLNPGVGVSEYFGELTQPSFRKALRADHRRSGDGFIFLDSRFSWHGGFRYWHSKFRNVIETMAERWHTSVAVARERFRRVTATVELVPYHSVNFGIPRTIMEKMPSVLLARDFVRDILVPRARNGKCLLIVIRAARKWGLESEECKNVVIYGNAEARAAYLTPKSRGGRRIIEFLCPKHEE